jgi:aspartyl-tRNA(Asn)/glutamyl-tRNA(Gln) amidotransferase subunit A
MSTGRRGYAMSGELAYLGFAEAAELIRAKKLSPVEYATALLARIERHDGKYNAFIALTPERALKAARAAEVFLAHPGCAV